MPKNCLSDCKYNGGGEKHGEMLFCGFCTTWFHLKCINLPKAVNGALWICTTCLALLIELKNLLPNLKDCSNIKATINHHESKLQEQANCIKELRTTLTNQCTLHAEELKKANEEIEDLNNQLSTLKDVTSESLKTLERKMNTGTAQSGAMPYLPRDMFSNPSTQTLIERPSSATQKNHPLLNIRPNFHKTSYTDALLNSRSHSKEATSRDKTARPTNYQDPTKNDNNNKHVTSRTGRMTDAQMNASPLMVVEENHDYFIGNCPLHTTVEALQTYLNTVNIAIVAIKPTWRTMNTECISNCFVLRTSNSSPTILDASIWPSGTSCHKLAYARQGPPEKVWGTNSNEAALPLCNPTDHKYKYHLSNCPMGITIEQITKHLRNLGIESCDISTIDQENIWRKSFLIECPQRQDKIILKLDNWPSPYKIHHYYEKKSPAGNPIEP